MATQISDYRLQTLLKRAIKRNPDDVKLFKAVVNCGERFTPQATHKAALVVSDGERAFYSGLALCKNPWCCPICSSYRMARYSQQIAAGIDAMNEQGQLPIMITFTIVHRRQYPCQLVTTTLMNSWRQLTVHKRSASMHFTNFLRELNSYFYVRTLEFTWGQSGWHPHIHALFWIDKDKLHLVEQFEETLRQSWEKIYLHQYAKQLAEYYTPEQTATELKKLQQYIDINNRHATKRQYSLFITKDKETNKPCFMHSSVYMCGWGANNELTAVSDKKASKLAALGHYNPEQMLIQASQFPDNSPEQNRWLDLYLEFARTVRSLRRTRVMFSHTKHPTLKKTIKQIILEWQQRPDYIKEITYVKKNIRPKTELKVVFWFSDEQWRLVSLLDTKHSLKHRILQLALLPNAKQLIEQFLLEYDIDCTGNGVYFDKTQVEAQLNQFQKYAA